MKGSLVQTYHAWKISQANILQRTPNFLLSGAFLSCNLGTAAMAFSTIDLLKKNFPNCHICVLSTRSTKDRLLYPDQHIQHDSRTSLHGMLILLRSILWWIVHKIFRKDLNCLRHDQECNVYYQANLLIDLSGDTITEDYGPLVLFSHCIPILIANCFGKPAALFGQTIGPFTWSKPFMRWLLRRCDSIIARDEPTYQYLLNLDISYECLTSSIDMAFLLESADPSQAETIEAECGYNPKTQLTLGMTVSRQFQKFVEKHPDRTDKSGLLNTLSEVIDRFVGTHNGQVILFAHVTGPTERLDDRVISQQLRKHCRLSDRVFVVDKDLDPRAIKALIARCDLFCGSRMHSNIAATTSGIPTIAMAYSVKSRGIMERMGMEDWVIGIPQLTADYLLKRLNDLLAHTDKVRVQLEACMPHLMEQAEGNIEVIRPILERSSRY